MDTAFNKVGATLAFEPKPRTPSPDSGLDSELNPALKLRLAMIVEQAVKLHARKHGTTTAPSKN